MLLRLAGAACFAAALSLSSPAALGAEVPALVSAPIPAAPGSPAPEGAAPAAPPPSASPAPASIAARALGRSEEEAAPPGLPSVGMWMISPKGSPADWLGRPCRGKRLLEPINVIIVDSLSSTAEEASRRLLGACSSAAFPLRQGHSSGYYAIIGSQLFAQFPPGDKDSFSDALFANDHGRIFGPLAWKGAFVFVGAFSRESVDLAARVKHRFESFDRARDSFAQRLSESGAYAISSFVQLGNAILGDAALSTGDHDGIAVLLSAQS